MDKSPTRECQENLYQQSQLESIMLNIREHYESTTTTRILLRHNRP